MKILYYVSTVSFIYDFYVRSQIIFVSLNLVTAEGFEELIRLSNYIRQLMLYKYLHFHGMPNDRFISHIWMTLSECYYLLYMYYCCHYLLFNFRLIGVFDENWKKHRSYLTMIVLLYNTIISKPYMLDFITLFKKMHGQ